LWITRLAVLKNCEILRGEEVGVSCSTSVNRFQFARPASQMLKPSRGLCT
jgi:hypothetical protein